MTFSPYTLNGHQFTGGGVDLTPPGAFKFSAMSGRLLKATNDDDDPRTVPAYNRMGYGLKAGMEKERYKVGVIAFYAKDDTNSIDSIPEIKGVLPQENLVVSIEGEVKLGNSFTLQSEYAATAISKDIRAEELDTEEIAPLAVVFNNRASTEYYNAIRSRLGYVIGRVNFGLSYERIDPGYETLGAYYFNNDFENITVDASNTFFNNKLALAINLGYQRDDLDNLKANNTNRTVGSANVTLTLSDRLTLGGSYSNFSTFTNVKPNQFDEINDGDLLDEELENLDYRQLSQSATAAINYVLSNNKKSRQNLNLNYALNDVANEQGGVVRIGDASTFHNMNIAHTINFTEYNLTLNTSLNGTYNTIGREEATTWGPTFSAAKYFFDKTLNIRISGGYNTSKNATSQTSVINMRGALTYTLKEQHNFSLNAVQIFREGGSNGWLSELTATFGYNYAFGLKKPKINLNKRDRNDTDSLRIRYRQYNFIGLPSEITPKLYELPEKEGFAQLIKGKNRRLNKLSEQLKETEDKEKKIYKEIGIAYLKELDGYFDFTEYYSEKLYSAYQKLVIEAKEIDRQIKEEYFVLTGKINSTEEKDPEDLKRQATLEKRNKAHKALLDSLIAWNLQPENMANPEGELKKIKERFATRIFEMYKEGKDEKAVVKFLEIRLADMFHKLLKEYN
ncbi:hypothetical protein NBT05_04005 [Aquimarina sp. ERC-38]|uniref:hypothetical protein n=1 Tax=Aquimarina sp. ERC-38 TaxID=2949996 RepID=UPI0022481C21|nr:hypothetical protein [Aquimarina sp. ERC-38]UZO81642.1 hypothetical protein NBT05_04005 [Aquimarina sp. ERC-38]